MTSVELRELLHSSGLARIAGELLHLVQPAVEIALTPTDDAGIRLGASKMGGLPDLPADVDWPSWHEPMAFIGQFNLGETAEHDQDGFLPRKGLLSFFYETDG